MTTVTYHLRLVLMIFHLPKLHCELGFSSFKILTCTHLDVTDLSRSRQQKLIFG